MNVMYSIYQLFKNISLGERKRNPELYSDFLSPISFKSYPRIAGPRIIGLIWGNQFYHK